MSLPRDIAIGVLKSPIQNIVPLPLCMEPRYPLVEKDLVLTVIGCGLFGRTDAEFLLASDGQKRAFQFKSVEFLDSSLAVPHSTGVPIQRFRNVGTILSSEERLTGEIEMGDSGGPVIMTYNNSSQIVGLVSGGNDHNIPPSQKDSLRYKHGKHFFSHFLPSAYPVQTCSWEMEKLLRGNDLDLSRHHIPSRQRSLPITEVYEWIPGAFDVFSSSSFLQKLQGICKKRD
ncbi:Trypsin-like serine protease [Candidatus Bealeia paramacronuclearis]|nr:Trypsin-like serine protease [Candidatus Bealeia paramacronuclearis]